MATALGIKHCRRLCRLRATDGADGAAKLLWSAKACFRFLRPSKRKQAFALQSALRAPIVRTLWRVPVRGHRTGTRPRAPGFVSCHPNPRRLPQRKCSIPRSAAWPPPRRRSHGLRTPRSFADYSCPTFRTRSKNSFSSDGPAVSALTAAMNSASESTTSFCNAFPFSALAVRASPE
jgi:hypothetical protein